MDKKKVGLFLLLAFGISWLSAAIVYCCGVQYGTFISTAVVAVFYMSAPAVAAMIVQKGIYKQPVKEMGLRLRQAKGKEFLWIPVFYLLLCFLWMGTILLFGNIFHLSDFGTITFETDKVLANLNDVTKAMGGPHLAKMPLPPTVLFFTQLISSFLVGAIINTIFTLGEELGWRGFLFNETRQMGFWKSNLLIGIIWGLWHAPIILQGHNFPEHPVAGVFIMVVFCVPLGYIMAYLRAKTNSVLAPAIFHATINAIGGNLMLYTSGGSDIIGSIAGISGALACVLIVLLIVVFDKKTINNYSISGQNDLIINS